MAFQTIPGAGLWIPTPPWVTPGGTPAFSGALIIDATGEKLAFCGHVFNKDHTSKTIDKVQFRFGTVTKAGGSVLTVSLQDVSTTTAPYQPDGTQDQFRAIGNAEATFASNTWYTSGLVTSDGTNGGSKRTVAFGERLAVVVEFDAGGRLGSDSIAVASVTCQAALNNSASTLNTGSWANNGSLPNVILEFSDGTFGTLEGGYPASAIGTLAFKQDTATADEYCMEMTFPVPVKVDAAWLNYTSTSAVTGDFDVVLYDGTSAMTGGTVSIDGAYAASTSAVSRIAVVTFAQEISLAANTIYRLALKPTQTTANITLSYFDVAAAGHFQAHAGGTGWVLNSRLDLGSWIGAVTTRRPFMGIRVSSLDDGTGGGTTNIFIVED